MAITATPPYLAGVRSGGVLAIEKGTQSSVLRRKVHHPNSSKAVLVCAGSVATLRIVSRLRETCGHEVAYVLDDVGHVGSGKGQSFEDFNEHEGAPNKPPFLAGMAAFVEGKNIPSTPLLSELNSIGSLCGTGWLSMVENQLLRGTVQATTNVGVSFDRFRQLASPGGTAGFCELYAESPYGGMLFDSIRESALLILEEKAIQFEASNVGFDPFRCSASPGGTHGFCELGDAESAYGGMLFDPFWESASLVLQGKAIQLHAKTAYGGMRFDQFRKSMPPSVTFLAAGSCELLTIQFKGNIDFMYVGGWFDLILMSLDGLLMSIYQGTPFVLGK